jgi:tripartite-type tricarboxylate transporter receptor subunit TctC
MAGPGTLSRRAFAAVAATALAAPGARAAPLPDRPVRMLCPWSPGGTADLYTRGVSPIIARHLGQSFIVENRGGASGSVGTAYLRNQRPDGSVIATVTEAVFRIALVQPVGYDPLQDFTFLAGGAALVWGWAVPRASPIRDLRDLVERGRARPGSLSYAAGGTAANPPLGMKVLEHRTGAGFLFVPYAGGGEMINAAMSGTVDVVFDSVGAVAGMVDGGEMRLLAVAAEERFPRWPAVPTAREAGFDVLHALPPGFIAPRGLPPDLAALFERAMLASVDDPEHAQLVQRLNLAPWRRDAAAYAAHLRDLFQTLPPLLRALGMLPA